MNLSNTQLWQRFQQHYHEYPSLGLSMDVSRMNFPDDFFKKLSPRLESALAAMKALEQGALANPDEGRMVGHYWLRRPELAPTPALRLEIESTVADIRHFAQEVHAGNIKGAGGAFTHLLVIGIGGSALGPQFVAHALGQPESDPLKIHFFDNTDPDGMDRVLAGLAKELKRTLCVVISKSGGTKETRNGLLEAQRAYEQASLPFAAHALAITGVDSALDRVAVQQGWLRRFPMWDWVGGRTSELSAVGLVPAALQGFDITALLAGARACDEATRLPEVNQNPAALLAAIWFYIGNGKGEKDMVILPYKDRLELFSRYLQQLVMESLGKELDLTGQRVHQGIAVYGNKGSTDQHAYVQQLRDGINNFFVLFVEVLRDRQSHSIEVEPQVTSGDYLSGFFLGTRRALYENRRESVTLTVREVSAFSIGVLIALFERAVGLYAHLVNINAYHQPGVEAGKKAASAVIQLQLRILDFLNTAPKSAATVDEIATALGMEAEIETVFKVLEHLSANPDRCIQKTPGTHPFNANYKAR